MTEAQTAWTLLLLPLIASGMIALLTLRSHLVSAFLSCAAILTAFGLALILFFRGNDASHVVGTVTWLTAGPLSVSFGLTLDHLSKLMLLIVTGVGSLIHIYSVGYMAGDPSQGRYFAKMSFFTFSMLGVVLASNFIQMFIFWELVGVSSYLLIGFWYERAAAAEAAKKAFLVNRIGDFGFLLGILCIWQISGSLGFDGNTEMRGTHIFIRTLPPFAPAVVALLIFCGAVGKSAQFPLHVWLPDAMEGPTPVSALIHAATMVAAGVYMLCRVFSLIHDVPDALQIIAWVGGITALMAALIGCVQNDIKRILAYSTLSQLGYMVMAVGLSGTGEAMFHLTTHSFFKALLFLAAGSVIIGLHHASAPADSSAGEQDIWKMGGLRHRMKWTFLTFGIGTLAISGLPLFSGFFSKDEILALAATKSPGLFAVGLLTAGLTAFYIWRLVFVAFYGTARSEVAAHAHESPLVMIVPLGILAVLSVGGGFLNVPRYLGAEPEAERNWLVIILALGVSSVGFATAWWLYGKTTPGTEMLQRRLPRLYKLLAAKFYFDEIYAWLVRNVQQALAVICDGFDRWLIAGFGVRGLTKVVQASGWTLRRAQRGDLTASAWVFAAGLLVIIYYFVLR